MTVEEVREMSVQQVFSTIRISEIENCPHYPRLCDIGSDVKQVSFMRMVVDTFYKLHGKCIDQGPNDFTSEDRNYLYSKLASKCKKLTIADAKLFGDMIVDRRFKTNLEYLTASAVMACWEEYIALRRQVRIQDTEVYSDDITSCYCDEEVLTRVLKKFQLAIGWWEEYIRNKPKDWQPPINNQEWEAFRQMKLQTIEQQLNTF